jgi:dTDP-4-dehydrorhamnose reductase
MKVLLFGKNGQLGWELQRCLACLGEVTALDYPEIDLSRPGQGAQAIEGSHPDVVVNAAAYTAVDKAESEVEKAYAVNQAAPAEMAQALRKNDALFIHYSTDYVFDGQKTEPYRESDAPNPISIYGKSKLAGEQAVQDIGGNYLILRTAWVYSLRGETFVNKILGWAHKNTTLQVVDDQVSNPTWARLLAEITAQILAGFKHKGSLDLGALKGIYHLAGAGYASRYEWALEILKCLPAGYPLAARKVLPAKSTDFPTPAVRPSFSALNCERFEQTFGLNLPHWKIALQFAMEDLRFGSPSLRYPCSNGN